MAKKLNDKATAKVFMSGASQAVRLPRAYRFKCDTVTIRKEGESLILTPAPKSWDDICLGEPDDVDELLAAALDDADLSPLEERASLDR